LRLLALPLLLLVSACDVAAPETPEVPDEPAAFVGAWDVASVASETYITSRVSQSVPDFSAVGAGGIEIAGAADGRLRYVLYVHRGGAYGSIGYEAVALSADRAEATESVGTILFNAEESPNGSQASVNLNTGDPQQDDFSGAFPAGTRAFSFGAGRLTVPDITLRAGDGSGRELRVGGALTFPLVPLQAGVETLLNRREVPVESPRTITFGGDGTYLDPVTWTSLGGRWREGAPGQLTVTVGSVTFGLTAEVVGGVLRLEQTHEHACTGECVPSTEAGLFAEPGSFERVRGTTVTTLRRAGS